MTNVYVCDAIRTPIGRYSGALATVRTDDLAALPLRALRERNPEVDWAQLDDVLLGCANQAGEDNRNIARMAALLAQLPMSVPGVTLNRLCGSGLDAVATGSRMIQAGEAELVIAGGVESMSRAPFVLAKSATPFARDVHLFDTTIGWRFVNAAFKKQYGIDTMPETAENVAIQRAISRSDQDAYALRSQQRARASQIAGLFRDEIVPVTVTPGRDGTTQFEHDEHLRDTSLQALAQLPTPFRADGTVTVGNASGINDGACAVLLASEGAAIRHGLRSVARVLGAAVAGVEPAYMGLGPVPAVRKLLARLDLNVASFDVVELNEAFAAQVLAVLRELGLPDDAEHVNAQGGAIALGHPLGMSGARLVTTAVRQLERRGGGRALCAMCIGVGQGIALALEAVA